VVGESVYWHPVVELYQRTRYSPSPPLVRKTQFSARFDLLISLSSAVCHTINMSLIVYNCGKPLLPVSSVKCFYAYSSYYVSQRILIVLTIEHPGIFIIYFSIYC
jgi:hypothetical protein